MLAVTRCSTVSAMEDEDCALELWQMKDLRRMFFAWPGRLIVIPQVEEICAKCENPKPKFANLRSDVGAMFNWAQMSEVFVEGPNILERHRRRKGASTVTVRHGRAFVGRLGGHTSATFSRDVVHFREMQQFMDYDEKIRLLVLGGDTSSPVVLEQKRGPFIGGRLSPTKTVIFLGRRAGCYLRNRAQIRRDGFLRDELGDFYFNHPVCG